MASLKSLQERLNKFDPEKTFTEVLKDTEKPEDLIKERLNKTGTRSTGEKIKTYSAEQFGKGVYMPFTIAMKKSKGQPTDRVTLNDTGKFQKSFEKKILKDAFTIEGDSKKPDGEIEDNIDFTNVLNLSKDEIKELVTEIKPLYIQEVRAVVGL
jgi:tRNA U34 5-carboxymethylaminomethyl modifying enzyme MnmG/GidA